MKDAAIIAERAANENWTTQRITKSINRYAARLVKAERDRCVLCVICSEDSHLSQTNEQMCRAIIRKINTPAKRPSRRK